MCSISHGLREKELLRSKEEAQYLHLNAQSLAVARQRQSLVASNGDAGTTGFCAFRTARARVFAFFTRADEKVLWELQLDVLFR